MCAFQNLEPVHRQVRLLQEETSDDSVRFYTLTLTNSTTSDSGIYSCMVVSSLAGRNQHRMARLTVLPRGRNTDLVPGAKEIGSSSLDDVTILLIVVPVVIVSLMLAVCCVACKGRKKKTNKETPSGGGDESKKEMLMHSEKVCNTQSD